MESNLIKLEQISKLQNNWNGYGAEPFSKELIDKCIDIIKGLKVQPFLSPTGRSSIQMEYEYDSNGYLEFEVFIDKITVLCINKHGHESTGKININKDVIDILNLILEKFLGEKS